MLIGTVHLMRLRASSSICLCFISMFYVIIILSFSRCKDTTFLSFNHFCCFYSINHHCVILDMKDIYPPFVVRHSSPQVLTFLQVHGPQFIEILVDRHPFAVAVCRHRRILLHCGRIAINESRFRRGRSGLLVDCIRFHRHIIIFFPIAKIQTFIEMTKT